MNEELKPCPFCGGEVRIMDIEPDDDDVYYMVECQNDKCNSATCFGEINKNEIKKRWNRRAEDER